MAISPASSAIPTYQEVLDAFKFNVNSLTPRGGINRITSQITLLEFTSNTASGQSVVLRLAYDNDDQPLYPPYYELYFHGSGYNAKSILLQLETIPNSFIYIDMFRYDNNQLLGDGGYWSAYIKYSYTDIQNIFCFGFTYSEYGYNDDSVGTKFFYKMNQNYYNCSRS